MTKKILILFFLFSLLCALFSLTNALAQQDNITITTYYPSPYGVYKRLRLHPSGDCETNTPCQSIEEGELCYYSSGTDKTLNVCNGMTWQFVSTGLSAMPSYPIQCMAVGCRPSGMAACFAACAPGYFFVNPNDWKCEWDPEDTIVTPPSETTFDTQDGGSLGQCAQYTSPSCPGAVLVGSGICTKN